MMISTGPKYTTQGYPEGALVFSATRKEKFDRCNRLWWLTEGGPLKLKEPDKGFLTFGTVLHSVIERWLKAPDLGISDAELYPEGWEWALDKDGKTRLAKVSAGEAAQIKELIAKAINEGVIERLPGQVVEHNFTREIIPPEKKLNKETGKEEPFGGVFVNSTIDLLDNEGIQDHKTTKAMKWAKSAEALKTNAQMLTYAMEFLQRKRERGEVFPEKIKLQHNVYCKDPDDKRIRKTIAWVTPEEVITFWQGVIAGTIPAMMLVRDLKEWHHVPGPMNPSEACNAYGGCFARSLCGKQETIEQFLRRHGPKAATTATAKTAPATQPETKETPTMSLLDRLKGAQAAPAGSPGPRAPLAVNATPVPVAAAVAKLPPAPIPSKAEAEAIHAIEKTQFGTPPPAPERHTPPWAVGSCTACEGEGFNSRGNPCRICDGTRLQNKGITSALFDIKPQPDGTIAWTPKPECIARLKELNYSGVLDGVLEGAHDHTGAAEVAVSVREAKAAPAPAAPADEPSSEEVEGDAGDAGDDAGQTFELPEPPAKRGPGRPRKGEERVSLKLETDAYIMFLGCRAQRNSGQVVYLNELIVKFGAELAEAMKIASLYELDVWKRQDALASLAKHIGVRCGGKSIMVTALTQENKALVEQLTARAKEVFVADGFYTQRGGG